MSVCLQESCCPTFYTVVLGFDLREWFRISILVYSIIEFDSSCTCTHVLCADCVSCAKANSVFSLVLKVSASACPDSCIISHLARSSLAFCMSCWYCVILIPFCIYGITYMLVAINHIPNTSIKINSVFVFKFMVAVKG